MKKLLGFGILAVILCSGTTWTWVRHPFVMSDCVFLHDLPVETCVALTIRTAPMRQLAYDLVDIDRGTYKPSPPEESPNGG